MKIDHKRLVIPRPKVRRLLLAGIYEKSKGEMSLKLL